MLGLDNDDELGLASTEVLALDKVLVLVSAASDVFRALFAAALAVAAAFLLLVLELGSAFCCAWLWGSAADNWLRKNFNAKSDCSARDNRLCLVCKAVTNKSSSHNSNTILRKSIGTTGPPV